MKRLILAVGCVVVLAVGVGSAVASSPVLTFKTAKGGPLKKGAQLRGFSSNLTFTTKLGNLECEENILIGTVEVNGAKKDHGPITEETSKGDFEGIAGACKTALGPAAITALHLPWSEEFTSKGTNETKGKKIAFTSKFLAGPAKGVECTFETATVKGTNNTSGPVVVKVAAQKFKENKKISNAACPTEGTLSGEFTTTSEGETIEAELS